MKKLIQDIINGEFDIAFPISIFFGISGLLGIFIFGEIWNAGTRTFWIGFLFYLSFANIISCFLIPFIPLIHKAIKEEMEKDMVEPLPPRDESESTSQVFCRLMYDRAFAVKDWEACRRWGDMYKKYKKDE